MCCQARTLEPADEGGEEIAAGKWAQRFSAPAGRSAYQSLSMTRTGMMWVPGWSALPSIGCARQATVPCSGGCAAQDPVARLLTLVWTLKRPYFRAAFAARETGAIATEGW